MSIRMTKPWIDLTPETVKRLPGQLGVYQLARRARTESSTSAMRAGAPCSDCAASWSARWRSARRRRPLPLRGQSAVHHALSGAADAACRRSWRAAAHQSRQPAGPPWPLEPALSFHCRDTSDEPRADRRAEADRRHRSAASCARRSCRSRPSSIPTPASCRVRTSSAWPPRCAEMGLLGPGHPSRIRRRRRRPRHAHADGGRDGAASRRPLRALLRRVRQRRAWPSSTRQRRTRSSAICIPCCAARSAVSSASPSRRAAAIPARAIRTRAVRDGERLDHQRLEGLHLGRRQGRLRPGVRPHRCEQGSRRRHLLHRRYRHDGLPRSPRRAHAALVALRHRAAVRGHARAATPTCWARSNRGFAIANERLSRQRIPYAAACIGVAVKAQEMAIDYAKQRETFGAPLATPPGHPVDDRRQ